MHAMLARPLAVLSLLGAGIASALAGITMTVNVENGERISGLKTFVVRAQSEALITSVEFYIGDSLEDTDSSTPYEFSIDTLNFPEGEFRVAFAAYNANGESARIDRTLIIDNELSLGAAHFIELGEEALVNSEWDVALDAGRRALTIEPTNNQARMIMARANLGKGVFDLAQSFIEDILEADPENRDALELRSAITLRQAFNAGRTGTDRNAALSALQQALRQSVQSRRTSLEILQQRLDADGSRLERADALVRANRFSAAIELLRPDYDRDPGNNAVANRLVYANIRAGRWQEAFNVLRNHEREGSIDGYGLALRAILLQYAGRQDESLAAEREAILNDPNNPAVRIAQLFLALNRGDAGNVRQFAQILESQVDPSSIGDYYLSAAYFRLGDFDRSVTLFERSILAEPMNYLALVERGNQVLTLVVRPDLPEEDRAHQRRVARAYFDAALEARPESFEALTAIAIVELLGNNAPEAVRFGEAAVAAGPEYAAAHYVLAGAYSLARQADRSRTAIERARQLDERALRGRPAPRAEEALRYFFLEGRIPVIPSPR